MPHGYSKETSVLERINWKIVVRKYWPGDLRDWIHGYMYAPRTVYRSPHGTMVKWTNEDESGVTQNPPVWWELRNNEGVLLDCFYPPKKGGSPPFRWAQVTIGSYLDPETGTSEETRSEFGRTD